MKLNHLNLVVADVRETRDFLQKYFGFRPMAPEQENDGFALLFDDDNLILSLLKASQKSEAQYPPGFHIGFVQQSEDKVNEINERLKADGFEVKPPRRFHGSWTFYFQSPGGFLVEVLC